MHLSGWPLLRRLGGARPAPACPAARRLICEDNH
jgi:hypothetical protein